MGDRRGRDMELPDTLITTTHYYRRHDTMYRRGVNLMVFRDTRRGDTWVAINEEIWSAQTNRISPSLSVQWMQEHRHIEEII